MDMPSAWRKLIGCMTVRWQGHSGGSGGSERQGTKKWEGDDAAEAAYNVLLATQYAVLVLRACLTTTTKPVAPTRPVSASPACWRLTVESSFTPARTGQECAEE